MTKVATLALGVSLMALSQAALSGAWAANVVTINATQIFQTIDPAKISDYTDYMATVNLYDGLATVDEQGSLKPELASSWDVSPDAKIVTFHLRPDAHFQDGTPVTADDVVYSVDRLLKINLGPANLFSDVLKPGSVTAVDPKTVKFTLSKTFAPFLASVPSIRIVNAKLVKANAGTDNGQAYLGSHVASSGPYTLKSWDRGSRMIIERDPHYYKGWGKGPIDEVRFVITNDEATVRSMAASGELTMTSQSQANDTYQALAKMDRFKVVSGDTATGFYLKFNTKVAPTDDVHIRKALACATDYQTIRETIIPGGTMTTVLPKTFAAFHLDSAPEPKLDTDCAQKEIAASKYAGKPIDLTLTYVAGLKFEEEVGLLMQSTLDPLGIKVKLEPEQWNRITEIATKVDSTPNVSEIFFEPTYPSPDSMFFTQFSSKAKGTWASMEWLEDAGVDKMIDDARATADPGAQAKIYKDLQQHLIDVASDAPLLTQKVQHGMDKCLTGFTVIPMQSFSYNFHNYSWTCAAK